MKSQQRTNPRATQRAAARILAIGLCLSYGLFTTAAHAANPVPFIDILSPVSAAPGGADFTLTVHGTGFVNGTSAIYWNGAALTNTTTCSSSEVCSVTVPAANISTQGTASVTVAGAGATSNVVFFPIIGSTLAVSFKRKDYAAGNGPSSVAVADFNGDGKLDLAVANRDDNTVSILLGNGDGTFQAQTTYATGVTPVSVAVGDFDNDGNLDLAVADACGTDLSCASGGMVSILLGKGDGTFGAQKTFATGVGPSFVTVGDFNGDGILDLAVANAGCVQFPSGCGSGQNPGTTLSILLGKGDGTFPTIKSSPTTGSNPNWIGVGDFNNDGHLDLAVADLGTTSSRGTTVTILTGKGDGTFNSPSSIASNGLSPSAVAVGDFNGDGNLDLAVVNACGTDATCASSGKVAILLGNGKAAFTFQSNTSTGSGPTALVVADLNADGNLDVAVANGTGSSASILLGDGTGNLTLQTSPAAPSTGSSPVSLALGDFNGDGGLDLVTANKNPATVTVLLQAPTATLSCVKTQSSGTCTIPLPPSPPSPTLAFNNEPAGGKLGPMTVTLTNSSNLPLNVSSLAVTSGAGDFALDTSPASACTAAPFMLDPGTFCTIGVDFTPPSQGGVGGVIQIADDAPGSPQLITLSGTGTAALASVAPTSLTFAGVTIGSTSAPQTVTVTNSGTVALTGLTIDFTGPDISEFNEPSSTCGPVLNASSSCTINVTFTPSAGAGAPQTATLAIVGFSGSNLVTLNVSLTGTGIAPNAVASPAMLSFPNQLLGTTSVAQTVNLSNSGAAALSISGISIGGTNASEYAQSNNCGSNVPAYGNCTVSVTFTPPITPAPASGSQTATLTITDNSSGTAGSAQTVPLSGTWVAPVASPSPGSLTFSQVIGSTSAPQTVTLSNTGTATLGINSISIIGPNASQFAETFTCLATLAAGSSCTISVTFSPSGISLTGPAQATLTITDNTNEVAGSTQSIGLTGSATSASTLTTIISTTPNPSIVGLPLTVSFTVADHSPGSSGTPAGTVTVTDGQTGAGDTCTGTLIQGAGSCTLTPSLSGGPGTKSLVATYSGEGIFGNFSGSTSAPVSQTVIKANTAATITSNTPNPSTVGLTVMVTFAVVPSPPGVGVPTGSVTVSDGTGDTCTGTLSGGTGSCAMPILTPSTPGPKPLTASYGGDTNFNTSVSPSVPQTVIKANTVTTITSLSPASVVVGQPVTVSFKVTPPAGDILTPTGIVTVTDGAGDSCAASLSNSSPDIGIGNCKFVPTSTGPMTITASYPGDSNFNASTGTSSTSGLPALNVVDFSTSVSPPDQVISSGHTATYTLTLNSLGGFDGTVNLSCLDSQPQTTCTVSPSSITVGGTIQTTVTVVASKAAAHGTFTLTFTGVYGSGVPVSGGLTHSSNAFLTIK